MATTRPFDAKSVLTVTDSRRQVALTSVARPAKVKTYSILVPAGKSRLLVMDDRVRGGTANVGNYLRIATDVEGVSAWPIDSITPDVGPDMRRFGWVLDWTLPAFEHDHGGFSDVAINHAVTGAPIFHGGTLPCFQDYKQDKVTPTGQHGMFFKSKPGPQFDVRAYDSNGMCVSDHSTSGAENLRAFHVLLGSSGYYDLGVHNDGLGFTLLLYVDDADQMNYPTLNFYSYPYIDGLIDINIIPTVTPSGDVVWSAGDRNLCRRNLVSGVLVGWDESTSPNHGPGVYGLINGGLPQALEDGLQSIFFSKQGANITASGSNCPVEGNPTWRRITMMTLGWAGAVAAADANAHIVNMFFSPAPGRWFEPRPYSYITATGLWANTHRPALGFQNPTDLDATLEVECGLPD